MKGMSIIVKVIARLLAPVMLLAAAYVVLHGHITHGGGFQGGVLIASTLLLLVLAYGSDFVERKVGFKFAQCFRGFGVMMIILTAIIGLVFGFWFFRNIGVYSYGYPGEVYSAGSLLLYNVGEMANVAACFLLIIYFFTRKDEER